MILNMKLFFIFLEQRRGTIGQPQRLRGHRVTQREYGGSDKIKKSLTGRSRTRFN
jgi:hypothetical protein